MLKNEEHIFVVTRTYLKTWRTKAKNLDEALDHTKKVRSKKIEHIATSVSRLVTITKKEVQDVP